MKLHIPEQTRKPLTVCLALIALAFLCSPPSARNQSQNPASATPVHLRPKLTPGQILRYQVQFQSASESTRGGAVQDPEGPSLLSVTWNSTIRMEILPAETASPNSGAQPPSGQIHLRVTYEKSAAAVTSDTVAPQAETIEEQYAKLEGHSIELALDANGKVSSIRGLEDLLSDEKSRSAAEEWTKQISEGVGAPAAGIVPGQKWTTDDPATDLPLAGLVWRTDSTYLGNEACSPASPTASTSATEPPPAKPPAATQPTAAPPAAAPALASPQVATPRTELCAVIQTRLSLVTPRKLKDQTPEPYSRNGVHTAGTFTSSSESRSYVSLQNGWAVSVTQDGQQQMDVHMTNSSAAELHYAGAVKTHSSVSLISNP